ncbi:hypothetical protein FOCC_FOCC016414 [Frankliniella occidentalis]|nr:hypothetical protein FOCC_FOCC016414 [Frankliniella occidentalis]
MYDELLDPAFIETGMSLPFCVFTLENVWTKCHYIENDMHPSDVPLELQNLSYIEKQIKKLEYKCKGQVINFTQNVQEVADKLPHLITDISNVVVKLQSDVTLRDFLVRKDKVIGALLWLKKHNPFYQDIKIDESNLNKLPSGSCCVYKELKMTISERDESKQNEKDDKITSQNDLSSDDSGDDVDDTDITFTSVLDSHNPTVLKSFTNQLVWPSVGTVPLNEFSSPG